MTILATTESIVLVDSDLPTDHCSRYVRLARMAYPGISLAKVYWFASPAWYCPWARTLGRSLFSIKMVTDWSEVFPGRGRSMSYECRGLEYRCEKPGRLVG